MEVGIHRKGNDNIPFRREIREWQRLDPDTGAFVTGRVEANQWINGPSNTYGKVIDSKNIAQPDGTHHAQRKELEVLQARTSSGAVQVIRAQTVQKKSSRWITNERKQGNNNAGKVPNKKNTTPHEEESRGNESNSVHGKSLRTSQKNMTLELTQPSHQTIVKHHIQYSSTPPSSNLTLLSTTTTPQTDPSSGKSGTFNFYTPTEPTILADDSVIIDHVAQTEKNEWSEKPKKESIWFRSERENLGNLIDDRQTSELVRGRSASTDDLTTDWARAGDDEPTEWRRVSKIRRSFQFPKNSTTSTAIRNKSASSRPLDLPSNSVSVAKIRDELESGRRLNTVMRNNNIDFAALGNILSNAGSSIDRERTGKKVQKTTILTAESLREIRGNLKRLSDESLYKEDFITQEYLNKTKDYQPHSQRKEMESKSEALPIAELVSKIPNNRNFRIHNNKDTNSYEWHLRRKSYGFEKMPPPDETKRFGFQSSIDSGLGRSGEIVNWSSAPRSTVITFGEPSKISTLVIPRNEFKDWFPQENLEIKRHSIAVDESKYVRENDRQRQSSIVRNGFNEEFHPKSYNKRVEFCKTEVHFAADTGRVNIVETDGKPPPTNNFRRRRRTSGICNEYLAAVSTGRQLTHFGDEKKSVFESEKEGTKSSNVTVTIPIAVCNNLDSAGDENEVLDGEVSIRGILKNKSIKPMPYHLGSNITDIKRLWEVKLKPDASTKDEIEGDHLISQSTQNQAESAHNVLKSTSLIIQTMRSSGTLAENFVNSISPSSKVHLSKPPAKPVPAPRTTFLQIRQDNDIIEIDNNGNIQADEEVSNYLNAELSEAESSLSSNDSAHYEAGKEKLNSWSRIKAKRSFLKIKPQNEFEISNQSNIMSIVLHSPPALNKYENKKIPKGTTRTEVNQQNCTQQQPEQLESAQGMRRLKDHELSYFGVQISNPTSSSSVAHIIPISIETDDSDKISITEVKSELWNTSSIKPDILRHNSPIILHEVDIPNESQTISPINENSKKIVSKNSCDSLLNNKERRSPFQSKTFPQVLENKCSTLSRKSPLTSKTSKRTTRQSSMSSTDSVKVRTSPKINFQDAKFEINSTPKERFTSHLQELRNSSDRNKLSENSRNNEKCENRIIPRTVRNSKSIKERVPKAEKRTVRLHHDENKRTQGNGSNSGVRRSNLKSVTAESSNSKKVSSASDTFMQNKPPSNLPVRRIASSH